MGMGIKLPRIVEVNSVPVVYVDDNGKIEIEGDNVRITYVEFRKIAGERVSVPVLEIVRPLASCRVERFQHQVKEALGLLEDASTH